MRAGQPGLRLVLAARSDPLHERAAAWYKGCGDLANAVNADLIELVLGQKACDRRAAT